MYDTNNVFARIIRGEIPAAKVYEDDSVLAFKDNTPSAPIHIIVVPKAGYTSFEHFTRTASAEEIGHFFKTVGTIAKQLGAEENGFRLVTNNGPDAGQTVMHFHVHILAGEPLGGVLGRRT
jgi:histidine triad (HIT) family protein